MPEEDIKRYTLEELRARRDRGETQTRAHAPEFSVNYNYESIRIRFKKWLWIAAFLMPFVMTTIVEKFYEYAYRHKPVWSPSELTLFFMIMTPSYLCILFLPKPWKKRILIAVLCTLIFIPLADIYAIIIGWDFMLETGTL